MTILSPDKMQRMTSNVLLIVICSETDKKLEIKHVHTHI